MIRITARQAYFETLHEVITQQPDTLAAIHADSLIPPDIVGWLGRLKLLYGVPFNYLVPDDALLPRESIRFFQVDLNWLYALIEGALSIARSSSSDEKHDAVFLGRLHHQSGQAARQIRRLRSAEASAIEHITGFFLRSGVVSGWSGLEVNAYDANDNLLTVLRMDRLSPSILLLMVEGVIAYVDIHEPAEGLHFGLDESEDSKSMRYVTVPSHAPPDTQPGDQIQTADPVPVSFRGKGVIKVDQLAQTFQSGLQAAKANNDPASGKPRPFTSAEFALQMIEGVQSVLFKNQTES